MGKSTISMAIFNSFLYVYQKVTVKYCNFKSEILVFFAIPKLIPWSFWPCEKGSPVSIDFLHGFPMDWVEDPQMQGWAPPGDGYI